MSSFLTNAERSYSGFLGFDPHLLFFCCWWFLFGLGFCLSSSAKAAKWLFRKHLPSGVNFFTYSNTPGLAASAASSTNEIAVHPSVGRKLRRDGFVPFQMQLIDFAQEVLLWS